MLNVLIISEPSERAEGSAAFAALYGGETRDVLEHGGSEACCSHNSQPSTGEQGSNDDKENDLTTLSLIQECQGGERGGKVLLANRNALNN